MATEFGVDFLGRIPICGELSRIVETGEESIQQRFKKSSIYPIFIEIAANIDATYR